jgi:hypothetical protein
MFLRNVGFYLKELPSSVTTQKIDIDAFTALRTPHLN